MLTFVVTLAITSLHFISCFNIDTDTPIVYESPSGAEDYFGYRVSLFSGDLHSGWIEITAPKGVAQNKPTGLLYRCRILGPCQLRAIPPARALDLPRSPKGDADDDWAGVSLDVTQRNGRDLICAHKWLDAGYETPGKCFTSNRFNETYESFPPANEKFAATINESGNWYYYRSYSQAGVSVHAVNSKTDDDQFLIGIPGLFNWFGSVAVYEHANRPVDERVTLVRPKQFAAQLAELPGKLTFFHYLGYSLSSGYYYGGTNLYYAVGAPRFAGIGKVIIFRLAGDGVRRQVPITGRQVGEYFGASIVSGDLNSDGIDDILIGAPYFKSDGYNEGRVDVYYGSAKFIYPAPNGRSIYGKAIGGQFGHAMALLNDVDGNGYPEIAISAPFEDDGSGIVYIFRSTANGLDAEPAQRLIGKQFLSTVKGFGASISMGLDVDGNHYPDVAIGAYINSKTFLFRSKPTVVLKHTLAALIDGINVDAKEFYVRYCLAFEGSHLPSVINVTRSIVVDESYGRAHLTNGHRINESVALAKGEICRDVQIVLKTNIQYDVPINVKLSQHLIGIDGGNRAKGPIVIANNSQRPRRDTFCDECVVYDHYRSTKTLTIDVPFFFNCGKDNKCSSNLQIDEEFVGVSSDGYVLGSKETLGLSLKVKNTGEKAIYTRIAVVLPDGVIIHNVPSQCEAIEVDQLVCLVANILNENAERTVSLDLNMNKINADTTNRMELRFNVTTLTTSVNLNPSTKIIVLPLKTELDVTVSGNSEEQSYNFVDGPFVQKYRVQKFGQSALEAVKLDVNLPIGLSGDDDVLINFESIVDTRNNLQIACSENKKIELKRKRKRRDLMANEQESRTSDDVFYLNCTNVRVSCKTITCIFGPMIDRADDVDLDLRLTLNATSLAKLLDARNVISVATEAMVTIDSPSGVEQYEDRPDYAQVESVFIRNPSKVSLLAIVLPSIVLGLLLLALLIYVCYKKGFFKREKREELEALKLQNEGNKDNKEE